MANFTELIRNVALAGHGGTGKTSLLEHILFQAGSIPKPEMIDSGKTVSDYSDEEITRKISIRTSLTHVQSGDIKINFMDSPGSGDFIGELILSLRACENTLVLVNGKTGVQIETIKVWRHLDKRSKSRMIFVSHMDEERASFANSLADVKDKFKVSPVAVTIPDGEGPNLKGIVDILNQKYYPLPSTHDQKESASAIPSTLAATVAEYKAALCEAAADGDDSLMEKYLIEGDLTQTEIVDGLKKALAAQKIVPAFAGSGIKNCGTMALLEFISAIGVIPSAQAPEMVTNSAHVEIPLDVNPKAPLGAIILKTQIDQFSGRLSYVKVFSGTLAPETEYVNVRDGRKEKLNKVFTCQGKKIEETSRLVAGDIGLIVKAVSLKTNDSICSPEHPVTFSHLKLPTPVHTLAISAINKKEEDKLNENLIKAAEEDLTFQVAFNAETKETVIAGMGELQINMVLDKIKNSSKIAAETRVPRVAYRETITKKATAEYTHKKQTGGHGQYARVVFEVEPLERGKGYEFENKVFGGAVSRGFMPGIEKGIHQAMENGIIAGYPVVDVKTSITDGKEHPVDSSEMAFKIAARGAFREASRHANAVLLEPIMNLRVYAEEKNLGDVMSDLSGRRGRISGQVPMGGGIVEIDAQVPHSELLRYAIDLRSMTSGTGSFEIEFDHYSPITGKVAEDVIKAAQAFRTHEEEED